MKVGDIQVELAQTNRWWRGPGWERDDLELRSVEAAGLGYDPRPLASLVAGGLYMLRGPRRVGKSTEIKRAIAGLLDAAVPARRIVRASVDGWRARDLRQLVAAAAVHLMPHADGPRYWFIDEITSVRGDWPSEVKWLRDNDPGFASDTVILTGSSSGRLDDATKALAGRRGDALDGDRVLLPMSFRNFCAASGLVETPEIPDLAAREIAGDVGREAARSLMPWLAELVVAWEVYLRVGGYPQAAAAWIRDREVDDALVEALWQVVHGDAITGAQFSPNQTVALLATLARNLCSPLNVSDLARDIDVSRATADARLADLTRAYQIWPVHHEEGLRPKLRARTKYYFFDPLLARLASLRTDRPEPDITQLNQQQLGLGLLRNIERHDPTGLIAYDRVLYHRSATGAEIDFVSSDLGRLAFESKYVDDRWGRELQTIAASRWFGVLATRSGTEYRPDALVLPGPVIALLLGR